MKQCTVCGEDIGGRGRSKYCLSCSQLIRNLANEYHRAEYAWAVDKAKRIVEERKRGSS